MVWKMLWSDEHRHASVIVYEIRQCFHCFTTQLMITDNFTYTLQMIDKTINDFEYIRLRQSEKF